MTGRNHGDFFSDEKIREQVSMGINNQAGRRQLQGIAVDGAKRSRVAKIVDGLVIIGIWARRR
jgi:hypothetical protein